MEWIEITGDTMPKENEYVLIFCDGYLGISRLVNGEWDVGQFDRRPMFTKTERIMSKLEAQYWMPFPDQPERSKREDSIPEYGAKSSLNYDEWEKRCGALNTMET